MIRHELTLDYQIKQARKLKALTAENGKMRAEIERLRKALEEEKKKK